MPLNVPKNYSFTPTPVGITKLSTRSSRRSRLVIGGSYFRSVERGESANLIQLAVLEADGQGLFVAHHTGFDSKSQVLGPPELASSIEVSVLSLQFNEFIRITKLNDSQWGAKLYGISWQIANSEVLLKELGILTAGKFFISPSFSAKIKIDANWASGQSLELRPRTHRVTLVTRVNTDSEGGMTTQGWDIEALRAILVSDPNSLVTMPVRAGTSDPGSSPPPGADPQDTGKDDTFLTAFPFTAMAGGDGLPIGPIGLNTGPDRTLIHLNYSELDDGTLSEFNKVYEWVGSTATDGSWQIYV